jgi:hypothetical protein
MHNVWRSFNGSGVSIGSVVYHAQQSGYIKKYEAVECDWDIDLSYLDVKTRKALSAHGLVGDIASWIVATAPMPQPQLALGAALTFVGMLKGHKYCTTTGLRTNLLTLNIAPTGSGKDYPQKCTKKLGRIVGLSKHFMARPTSGTGLLTGLQKGDRVSLLTIDEVGRFLEIATNKNAGGWQKEIIGYIIELYSCANNELNGRQYANEKTNPTVEMINPHLCVLGSSVKERIVEACTSKVAIDGFLNRWILFETEDEPDLNENVGYKIEPPQHIINQIQKIIDEDPNGQYPVAEDQEPIVKVVRYTPEAYAIIQEFRKQAHELKKMSKDPIKALYGRTWEHVTKIALTLCDNEFVRTEDVNLAIEIVTESNKLIADFAGLISDNQFEADYIKVRELIFKAGSIKRNDLTRKLQSINGGARRRNEILKDLVDSGEIGHSEEGKLHTFFKP